MDFRGNGYTGSAYYLSGLVRVITTELFSGTAGGSAIVFINTPNTTHALAEAGRFGPSGGFSVGTSTDPGIGTISANVKFTAAGVVGVTCSGAPTASFASTGGIVTHC